MRAVARAGAASIALAGALASGAAAQGSSYEELQVFSGVLNTVRLNYADSVGYPALVRSAITGVLSALDPHSYYVSREEAGRLGALDRGELATAGLALEMVEGAPTILAVRRGSPSEKAGIQPGDRLLRVNDTSVAGLGVEALRLKLAGAKGTRLVLRLARGPRLEPDSISASFKLDYVRESSVTIARMMDPKTGYIRLESFGPAAGNEVRKALERLEGLGAGRLILDLRGNPGGLVTQAVEIAQEFLPSKTVVFRTTGRKRDMQKEYVTGGNGRYRHWPLVVLLDGGSASASEALAGALQDHDRALVVGRRSFGKALIQVPFDVPPRGDLLMLTVGHVVTPSGRVIQRRYQGITVQQYRSFAGATGAPEDTAAVFRTGAGRSVRGGGGIAPDVPLPEPPPRPAWVMVASDSALDVAVADSVAQTLAPGPAGRAAWIGDPARWQASLLPPYLERVRQRLGVTAGRHPVLEPWLARQLAARVAEVRWGADAAEELLLRSSADVSAAAQAFATHGHLLRGSSQP